MRTEASQQQPDAMQTGALHIGLLQRQCACGGTSNLTGTCSECEKKKMLGQSLQTKLQINEPGDEYEREADRVAAQVMRMPDGQGERSQVRWSRPVIQRFVGDHGGQAGNEGSLQRAEAAGEKSAPVGEAPASKEATPKDGSTEEAGSRCPSWRNDPESISKRAAENYVQHDITPPSQARVEKINCEPPVANGNYGCFVHFSDGLVVRVIVRATDIVVGMGPGQIATETPPPATPLCFYDYHCPDGLLVLTKRECKSAKSSKPHPPGAPSGSPAVAQRKAASETVPSAGSLTSVQHVLASPGRPLDASTREFFAARFGHDFGAVRVHDDATAAASARGVQALAYTVGRDLVFGAGQYSPGTSAGRHLLAHELTHVVQQSGMGSSPSMQRKAAISPSVKSRLDDAQHRTEPAPLSPVDCAVEIAPAHDCFALIAELIAIQADMRENNQWLERYRNGDIPWDADAYTTRARYQGDLRTKFDAKERIRKSCCAGHEVPDEAPTLPSAASPAPDPQPVTPDSRGSGG